MSCAALLGTSLHSDFVLRKTGLLIRTTPANNLHSSLSPVFEKKVGQYFLPEPMDFYLGRVMSVPCLTILRTGRACIGTLIYACIRAAEPSEAQCTRISPRPFGAQFRQGTHFKAVRGPMSNKMSKILHVMFPFCCCALIHVTLTPLVGPASSGGGGGVWCVSVVEGQCGKPEWTGVSASVP